MLRTLLAVFAGYAVMAVLVVIATGVAAKRLLHAADLRSVEKLSPTPAYLAVNLAYSLLFAIVAGWVTAALDPKSPVTAIRWLAAFTVLMAVVSWMQGRESRRPNWYAPVLLLLGIVGVLLGGYLRVRIS